MDSQTPSPSCQVILLAYPWLLALLLLPLIARMLLPAYHPQKPALWAPWYARVVNLLKGKHSSNAQPPPQARSHLALTWAIWTLLVLALARPQFLEEPISQTVPTRDLLLIVDLSGSMEANDFTSADGEKIDRLTAVKSVLDEFLERRQGDRVGLIVFGNAPVRASALHSRPRCLSHPAGRDHRAHGGSPHRFWRCDRPRHHVI